MSKPAPGLTNTEAEAARRARRQATVVASLAAVVPTVLAAQGMATLAMDVLGFPLAVAIALAGFLELALVSSALLARASALAGRPGGADAAAVWAVSIVSGALAATHEFVGPVVGGVRGWEVDPGSLLAAGVRVAAPLVAAWLWERVLTAARREHAQRTLVELRRDRRLLSVARAALAVRRIEVDHDGPQDRWQASRARRARRRLDRAHVAALRTGMAGAADLPMWLAAVGAVDVLPAATIVRGIDTRPAVGQSRDDQPIEWLTGPQAGLCAGLASRREPDWEPVAGSPGQRGPVHGPADRLERAAPNQAAHEGANQGGSGWLAGHQEGRRLAPEVDQRATEPQAGSQAGPALGRSGRVGNHPEPARATRVSQVPVVVEAEAAVRLAAVLDLAAQGLSQRAIASRLGIARSTVARAVARGNASEPPAEEPAVHLASHPRPESAPVGHGEDHGPDQRLTEGGSPLARAGLAARPDYEPAR
jgi:hypothetical protein